MAYNKRWFPNYQASECVDILICMTYQYGYRQDKTEEIFYSQMVKS